MPDTVIVTKSSEETFEVGRKLGKFLTTRSGIKVGFTGDLGAGKTLFIKGVVSVLMPEVDITSPSFSIINEFGDDKFSIFHVDLYRIHDIGELFGTGFFEAFDNPNSTMLIEWIDRFNETYYSDSDIILINIHYVSTSVREITIKNWGVDCLK